MDRHQFENRKDDPVESPGDAAGLSNYAWLELSRAGYLRPAVSDRQVAAGEQLFIPDWARRHNELLYRRHLPLPPEAGWNQEAMPHQQQASLAALEAEQPESSNLFAAGTRRIRPGPNGVPGRPPEGYQAIRGRISPGVVAVARSLLRGDYGTETPFQMDGKRYMARVEPHYGPPGRKNGPVGWHKGVTVYEAAT